MSDPYAPPSAEVLRDDEAPYQPRLFSISGRIGRLRYIAYSSLANLLILPVIGMLAAIFIPTAVGDDFNPVFLNLMIVAFYIPVLVVYFIFVRRRLHDLNQSGWFSLIGLIPIVNLVFVIYIIFFKGTQATNEYGPRPTSTPWYLTVFGLILPIVMMAGILAAVAIPAYQDYLDNVQAAQSSVE